MLTRSPVVSVRTTVGGNGSCSVPGSVCTWIHPLVWSTRVTVPVMRCSPTPAGEVYANCSPNVPLAKAYCTVIGSHFLTVSREAGGKCSRTLPGADASVSRPLLWSMSDTAPVSSTRGPTGACAGIDPPGCARPDSTFSAEDGAATYDSAATTPTASSLTFFIAETSSRPGRQPLGEKPARTP